MEGSLSVSNNEKRTYYANSAVGIVSGYSAYKYLPKYIRKPYSKYFLGKCKKITSFENNRYWNSAISAFRNSRFFNNNLQIVNLNDANWEAVADNIVEKRSEFIEKCKNNPVKRIISKIFSISNATLKSKIKVVAEGENACFVPLTSQVLVNSDKMGITAFHEIGHFINKNGTGIRKFLSNSRAISILALPAILAIGLFTPKREKGDEYQNPIGQAATFIKKHCGVLAALSMLPVVVEEGAASINGAKLAKTVLDKGMYKKLNKLNTLAFGSYALGAATIGLCAALAVHIKDLMTGTAPRKN